MGEELAYRGYLLERMAAAAGSSRAAYLAAVPLVSLLFGLGHFDQGPAGTAGPPVSGLFFGALYLAAGRNL